MTSKDNFPHVDELAKTQRRWARSTDTHEHVTYVHSVNTHEKVVGAYSADLPEKVEYDCAYRRYADAREKVVYARQ